MKFFSLAFCEVTWSDR